MRKEKTVIIIPTYNEAAGIEETIEALFKITAKILHHEIIVLVFDSASTDNTQNIILRLQKRYTNLHLKTEPQKSGLGSAYKQAMQYALTEMRADIIMEFDADLSHNPKYIPYMLQTIRHCDVVIGSRYIRGGSIPSNWGWHRKFISILGNLVARLILTPKYKDFTSGFRLTRRHALEQALLKDFLSNHYAYKLQLVWMLHKNAAKIREYPIAFIDRQKGNSKLPANSIIDSLRVICTLRWQAITSYVSFNTTT